MDVTISFANGSSRADRRFDRHATLIIVNTGRVVAVVSLGVLAAVVVVVAVTADDDAGPASRAFPTNDAQVVTDQPAGVAVTGEPIASESGGAPDVDANVPELENLGPHPEFLDVEGWLQSEITSLDELHGNVIAVQFWTFACSNCKATLSHMQALYAKYGGEDFEIVGIHAPEFDFERDPEAIAQAAKDLGVTWPIALDTEKLNFRSWQERRFWPRLILIDRNGNMRFNHVGEGKYDEIDAAVGALIAEDV